MRRWRVLVGLFTLCGVGALGFLFGPAGANTGDVVINEIFYNQPDVGDFGEDFVELHNPGTSPVDLTGYTLDDSGSVASGRTVVLSGTLPAGGYGYITRSGYDATAFWGVAPLATMNFGLSGSTDTVTVRDPSGNLVDEVTYDDGPPWPGEADGDGSSLELVNPLADNAVPNAWAASTGAPTPGVVNSVFGTNPPEPITNVVATPLEPSVNQPITVVAEVPGETAPQLSYVIGFGNETTITMVDNGVAPDVSAGDGVFAAQIPGQAAGELVRYSILAPATGEEFPTGDARRYEGVVVDDPSEIPTTMVNMEWFIPDPDFNAMFDDPRIRDIYALGSVLAIDGVVYDNIEVKIRGGDFARNVYDKQGLSIDLPGGVDLDRPDLVPYPIDEFALSAERGFFYGRPDSAWQVFEDAGFPPVPGQHIRMQRNGEFFGIFRFGEKLDGTWRDQHGIDGGFYKAEGSGFGDNARDFEKNQPDDGDLGPIMALADVLQDPASQAKSDYLYRNVDIANAVNYTAAAWITGHLDSSGHNFYMHEDTEDTGLWQIYPWDLSNAFGVSGGGCDDASDRAQSATLDCVNNVFYDSVRELPGFEDMVWRRIRTLIDGPVADGVLEGLFEAYHPTVSPAEQAADRAAWPTGVPANYRTPAQINAQIDLRRGWLETDASYPSTQPAVPGIVINELTYAPANGVEFLELHNPTNSYVDLTGWTIPGIDFTAPGGLVIAPGGFVVLTEDIPDLIAAYPNLPNVPVAQYDGGLSSNGELLQLRTAAGALVDTVAYDNTSPWPAEPAAGQVSLSLDDPASNNNAGSNWGISQAIGGTPGEANDTVDGTVVTPPAVVINEVHYNPDGSDTEFVELHNTETTAIDVSGWNLDGLITFPTGTTIPAGGYLVATENLAAFQNAYPGVPALQWGTNNLDNGGENVFLDNNLGVQIDAVAYDDTAPWPTAADGTGPSLELLNPTLDNTLPTSWFAATIGGTPGAANATPLTCNNRVVTVDLNSNQTPTAGDDVIWGTTGPDIIIGLTGNDVICGNGGNDIINAGPGNDTIFAGPGDDTVFGLDGNDTIFGQAGNDELIGFADDDFINGGPGQDNINGGPGNDTLTGADDNDTIFGQAGDDTIFGGDGDDTITAVDGNDTLHGGNGNDILNAGPGTDTANGNDGDDTIFGLTGNDNLNGNDGDDTIFGQPGNDNLNGGAGDDRVLGNEGNDTITDPSGTNALNGGIGDDTITGGTGTDSIFGDADNTQAGDDTLDGGAGQDLILGFAGNDTITANDGEQDTINGGPNTDTCNVDTGAVNDTVFNCEN